jgi:hypothetical protein
LDFKRVPIGEIVIIVIKDWGNAAKHLEQEGFSVDYKKFRAIILQKI